jgi:hypothetical protein
MLDGWDKVEATLPNENCTPIKWLPNGCIPMARFEHGGVLKLASLASEKAIIPQKVRFRMPMILNMLRHFLDQGVFSVENACH